MVNNKNRILAMFFIAFFAINIILPSIVLLHFKVNQDFIAKNLCIEKDIEESTCEGNCQLKKNFKVIEKGNSNQDELQFNIESHISFLFTPIVNKQIKPILKGKPFFTKLENKNPLSGYYDVPFRPPILY